VNGIVLDTTGNDNEKTKDVELVEMKAKEERILSTTMTATTSWKYFDDGSGMYRDYTANLDTTWIIKTTNPSCRVVVEFVYIRIEKGYDFVKIYQTAELESDYFDDHPMVGPWYASEANKLGVRFTSDSNVHQDGFRAKYIQNCATTIPERNFMKLSATNSWKTLDYPAQNKLYEVRLHLFWLIQPSTKNCKVIVQFNSVLLDQPTYDEDSNQDYLLVFQAGRNHDFNDDYHDYPTIGERMIALKDYPSDNPYELAFQLNTNADNRAKGFVVQYKQVCNSNTNDDWRYNEILSASNDWKTVKDSYPTGIAHPYGISRHWSFRPTSVGCKARVELIMLRDTSTWGEFDGGVYIYLSDEAGSQSARVGLYYDSTHGNGRVSLRFYVSSSQVYSQMFEARYRQVCY